jgi:hypothetical protein
VFLALVTRLQDDICISQNPAQRKDRHAGIILYWEAQEAIFYGQVPVKTWRQGWEATTCIEIEIPNRIFQNFEIVKLPRVQGGMLLPQASFPR